MDGAYQFLDDHTIFVDEELQLVLEAQLENELLRSEFNADLQDLADWVEDSTYLSNDQTLDPFNRLRLLSVVNDLDQATSGIFNLSVQQPESTAMMGDYRDWIDQILTLGEIELSKLKRRGKNLEVQRQELSQEYASSSEDSLGLSPNLNIKELETLPARRLHPTGSLIIIGGLIGLAVWIVVQLAGITNKLQQQ